VEVVETLDDPNEPYRVCTDCHRRLISLSLRPIEWYNLSAIHGRLNDLLSADLYDEKDGSALEPTVPVIDAELFPCPKLEDVADSPERLLTYTLTRREIQENEVSALRRHSPKALLPVLSDRLNHANDAEIARAILRLIGLVLGPRGAALVLDNWERFASTHVFPGLAFAASKCLPLEEGHAKVTEVLSRMDSKERNIDKGLLAFFESQLNLDWLEENAHSPVILSWGSLAASSRFDWERARKWLASGRPLSLVALDALSLCARKERGTPLLNPPTRTEFVSTLEDYLSRDSVPRVRRVVSNLLELCEIPLLVVRSQIWRSGRIVGSGGSHESVTIHRATDRLERRGTV
jgi:hypothetical protein